MLFVVLVLKIEDFYNQGSIEGNEFKLQIILKVKLFLKIWFNINFWKYISMLFFIFLYIKNELLKENIFIMYSKYFELFMLMRGIEVEII